MVIKNVAAKAKENPMMTSLLTAVAMIGAAVGVWEGVELADKLHVTEAELIQYDNNPHMHAAAEITELGNKIDTLDDVGQCRWMKSEIRALKDSIYARKRDSADADYIHDLEEDLSDLETDYTALGCARLLA